MSEEYNDLSAEITRLGGVWYELVNIDHHKDRDCHWGIDVVWSYGEPPKFRAWHDGYVYERISKDFRNLRAAMVYVRDELTEAINGQKNWATSPHIDDEEDDYWNEGDKQKVVAILTQAGIL